MFKAGLANNSSYGHGDDEVGDGLCGCRSWCTVERRRHSNVIAVVSFRSVMVEVAAPVAVVPIQITAVPQVLGMGIISTALQLRPVSN